MQEARPWLMLPIAVLVAGATLAGCEEFWLRRGHHPTVVDDADLWCQQRRRVEGDGQLVLAGASRILLGFSLERARKQLPSREPIQLAIGAGYPMATLRDLAGDDRFRGVLIVSLTAQAFEPEFWNNQEAWVRSCRLGWNLERRVGRVAKTALEERFVTMTPRVSLREVGRSWMETRALPTPWWVHRRRDRSGYVDFALQRRYLGRSPPIVRAGYEGHVVSSPSEWEQRIRLAERWVDEIQSRGGRVALVRYPTSGRQWELDEEAYPKSLYWDVLAERTSAVALHFLDDARLVRALPDESHLSPADIPAFTDALIDGLRKRGLFPIERSVGRMDDSRRRP